MEFVELRNALEQKDKKDLIEIILDQYGILKGIVIRPKQNEEVAV